MRTEPGPFLLTWTLAPLAISTSHSCHPFFPTTIAAMTLLELGTCGLSATRLESPLSKMYWIRSGRKLKNAIDCVGLMSYIQSAVVLARGWVH